MHLVFSKNPSFAQPQNVLGGMRKGASEVLEKGDREIQHDESAVSQFDGCQPIDDHGKPPAFFFPFRPLFRSFG